jgi:hypothetical protein
MLEIYTATFWAILAATAVLLFRDHRRRGAVSGWFRQEICRLARDGVSTTSCVLSELCIESVLFGTDGNFRYQLAGEMIQQCLQEEQLVKSDEFVAFQRNYLLVYLLAFLGVRDTRKLFCICHCHFNTVI